MKKVFSLLLAVSVLLAIGISASAVTYDLTVGTDVGQRNLYTVTAGETITNVAWSGSIPAGLSITHDEHAVWLSGTPTAAGSYSFTLNISVVNDTVAEVRVIDVNGTITASGPVVVSADTPTATATPTPNVTTPPTITEFTVTKHPGAETRIAGETAIFIAKAANATGATWVLVSPDGGEYNVDTFKQKYPSIAVSYNNDTTDGIYTTTINMANIPKDISGYSAYAIFSDATGRAIKTNSATVTVTTATPSPAPTVDPAAVTPMPTPVQVSTPTPVPTADPTPVPVVTIAPVTSTPEEESGSRGLSGSIILTVLVGLFTLAIAVLLILYVQGKLDLSWLEQKLERKNTAEEEEDPEPVDTSIQSNKQHKRRQEVEEDLYTYDIPKSKPQVVSKEYVSENHSYVKPAEPSPDQKNSGFTADDFEDDL